MSSGETPNWTLCMPGKTLCRLGFPHVGRCTENLSVAKDDVAEEGEGEAEVSHLWSGVQQGGSNPRFRATPCAKRSARAQLGL